MGERQRSGHTFRGTARQITVLILSLLVTAGIYAALWSYAPGDSILVRYLSGHWVEYIETWLFAWAMLALIQRLWLLRRERSVLGRDLLEAHGGTPVPPSKAGQLLQRLDRLPARFRATIYVRRLRSALEFIAVRQSTRGLEDHLRDQAEADADYADGSLSLVRFITWAVPILGFLGTVLGITNAVANVTPEQITQSISSITDGLAVAFDTTALALGYSICLMFFTFVVDRSQQLLLHAVDSTAYQVLTSRFTLAEESGGEALDIIRTGGQRLMEFAEQLVQRQSLIWTESLLALNRRVEEQSQEQQARFAASLENLLDRTLAAHQERLDRLEEETISSAAQLLNGFNHLGELLDRTRQALERQCDQVERLSSSLKPLAEMEREILRLQETMRLNLETLASGTAIQDAVHSLTAAIHLLTVRAGAPASSATIPASQPPNRPSQGNAA